MANSDLKRLWSSVKYYAVGLWNYTDEDHCFLLAAGIAYNVLYCLLPLSLVTFYFFSAALTSEKAITYVLNYITESFPLPVYEEDLKAWIGKKFVTLGHESHIAGLIGGITLLWLASILFSTLRTSINAVFNMPSKTSMIYQKALDFVLMIVIFVLLLSSTFIDPVLGLLQRIGTRFLPDWLGYLLSTTAPYFVSLGISILLYMILFRMLPHERLSRMVVFVSAATTVVLTELMRPVFAFYMGHVSSIGTLYGTYAFLVGTSLWIYYASLAFLIGAEVGWLYKEKHEPPPPPELTPIDIALAKDPGPTVNEPEAIEHYDAIKPNPTRPAGEGKV